MFTGNEATDWGVKNEPTAFAQYTYTMDRDVALSGFVRHSSIDWIGGSPDGLAADRVVEIKCPFSGEVYESVPPQYMAQVQGLMEVCDLPICDLAVWTPTKMRVFTIERSRDYWLWMYPKLAEFWSYVQANVEPPRAKKTVFDFSALVTEVKDHELV